MPLFTEWRVPTEEIMQAISRPEGGGAILPISEIRTLGAYQDDWEAVSHNFELLPDCSGLFSILLERPAMGPVEEQKGRSADRDPGPKISHAAIEANTNPTTAIAKPAKPITAHPPMPSCQGSPRRSLAAAASSTSAPATIAHIAPPTNKPTPAKYHMPGC